MRQSISSFYETLLFLLLSIVLVSSLLFEVKTYETIKSSFDKTRAVHLPHAYISQKLRGSKYIDTDNNVLVLNNEDSITYIYFYDGYLCELTTLEGYRFNLKSGEKLFEADYLNVKTDNGVLVMEYSVKGKSKNIYYSLPGVINE